MTEEKKYPFTGETNQRSIPFGNTYLTPGEYLCGISRTDLFEVTDYYKFTLAFRRAFAEIIDQVAAIENEPDYDGVRIVATTVRGILENTYALANASLFEYVFDVIQHRPNERANLAAGTAAIWSGDADQANKLFGDNYGVDWAYIPDSQSIMVKGRTFKVGDSI